MEAGLLSPNCAMSVRALILVCLLVGSHVGAAQPVQGVTSSGRTSSLGRLVFPDFITDDISRTYVGPSVGIADDKDGGFSNDVFAQLVDELTHRGNMAATKTSLGTRGLQRSGNLIKPDEPFDSIRKRYNTVYAPREDLYKRSRLNKLIRRLMAMNGQNFNRGRATTIRFGVGGR